MVLPMDFTTAMCSLTTPVARLWAESDAGLANISGSGFANRIKRCPNYMVCCFLSVMLCTLCLGRRAVAEWYPASCF
jgi:hypothetical protein